MMESSKLFNSAVLLKNSIETIDAFIQKHTAEVCPNCRNVCCINRHGYYDYADLVYIQALGLELPAYKKDVRDTDCCQFLSVTGCAIERSLRPFRCNWYFCGGLLKSMEDGAAKQYRQFIKEFQKVIELRKTVMDTFLSTTF
ncbi:MAG: hypothetical protein ACLQF0_08040 [Dissulfurispiraceae bacterium]